MANNPVQRLYDTLNLLRQERKLSVSQACAKVLGIGELGENFPLFFRRVGIIYSLINLSKNAISKIDSAATDYSHSIKVVANALQKLNWQDQVQYSAIGQISEADMRELKMTAARVTELSIESEISQENIDSILNQIDAFIDDIKADMGISEDLKSFIFERLDSLRFAIEFYRFSGSNPIAEAVDALWGGVTSRAMIRYTQSAHSGENLQSVCKRTWTIVSKIYCVLHVAHDTFQIGQTIVKLLSND